LSTWKKLSRDCERSAHMLKRAGYLRGCINRAYYAVYSAATMHLLACGYVPESRREGPPHGDILNLTARIRSIPRAKLDAIDSRIRALHKMRLHADYFASKTVDARMAEASLVLCRGILKELESYE
jgi:uncharacterized protein (UPF0332 family)